MADTALGQAIRNAIEAERAAARFYGTLAASTEASEAVAFLEQMVVEEEAHAKAISEMGSRLEAGELPLSADTNCALVETAPEWRDVEGIGIDQALEISLEAEIHAALYYDALADSVPAGPVRALFQAIARTEEAHIKGVEKQLDARRRAAGRSPRR